MKGFGIEMRESSSPKSFDGKSLEEVKMTRVCGLGNVFIVFISVKSENQKRASHLTRIGKQSDVSLLMTRGYYSLTTTLLRVK